MRCTIASADSSRETVEAATVLAWRTSECTSCSAGSEASDVYPRGTSWPRWASSLAVISASFCKACSVLRPMAIGAAASAPAQPRPPAPAELPAPAPKKDEATPKPCCGIAPSEEGIAPPRPHAPPSPERPNSLTPRPGCVPGNWKLEGIPTCCPPCPPIAKGAPAPPGPPDGGCGPPACGCCAREAVTRGMRPKSSYTRRCAGSSPPAFGRSASGSEAGYLPEVKMDMS